MDVSQKIKELRGEIQQISADEKAAKNRIAELKNLLTEKKNRETSLKEALAEEQELLKELGLV